MSQAGYQPGQLLKSRRYRSLWTAMDGRVIVGRADSGVPIAEIVVSRTPAAASTGVPGSTETGRSGYPP